MIELNLSQSKMSISSLGLLMESLNQNDNLRTLSLKGISLMSYTSAQKEIDESFQETFPKGFVKSDDKFRIETTR